MCSKCNAFEPEQHSHKNTIKKKYDNYKMLSFNLLIKILNSKELFFE